MSHYVVRSPFRILALRGSALANGASPREVIPIPVYEARNTKPGDIVACLPVGTYLFGADKTDETIALVGPRRAAGEAVPDETHAEALLASGHLDVSAQPERRIDLKGIQARTTSRFPDRHKQVIEQEPSPEMARLKTALRQAMEFVNAHRIHGRSDERGAAPRLLFRDMTTFEEWGAVRCDLYFGGYATSAGKPDQSPRLVVKAGRKGGLLAVLMETGEARKAARWKTDAIPSGVGSAVETLLSSILGPISGSQSGR